MGTIETVVQDSQREGIAIRKRDNKNHWQMLNQQELQEALQEK